MSKLYPNDYVEKTFYIWYENDRPSTKRLSIMLPKSEGRTPSSQILDGWKKEKGWEERADALDAQLSVVMDTEVIDRRIKMFDEHAKVGEMIIQKGKEYFENHEIDDANAALRAIDTGVEIQRISVGQAQAWAKVSRMTDEQLVQELKKLTGKTSTQEDEFPLDVDTDNIIDVESNEENREEKTTL